ncbi:MAG: hypothetical protein J6V26_04735 [Alistipes sp.]|nr:hypothetical protein [Alistipes sp.]
MNLRIADILITVILAMISLTGATAQELASDEEFDYRDFKFYKEDPEDDISLWGGLYELKVEQQQDRHYLPKYRYALAYATSSYRGFRYEESRNTFGNISIDYKTIRSLKALGYDPHSTCGIVGSAYSGALGENTMILLGSESRLYDRQSLRVELSGRNYLMSVNYRGVYTVLDRGIALKDGWTLMSNARVRTGRDIYVDGVFTNALDLSVGASYADRNNNLELTLSLPWSERGLRQASTEEAYRLTHNKLYNPSWGMQSGKVRNSRVATTLRPEVVALWRRRVSATTYLTLASNIYVERYGTSTLTWFNTPTPAPDNYKYMPSYFHDANDKRIVEEAWMTNDLRYTQVDWERLYHTNSLQQDGHASYAVTSRRTNTSRATVNTGLRSQIKEMVVDYGVELSSNRERNFRIMDDLLGASHIIDKDYYIEDDATYSHLTENNLHNPNHRVAEGDRYGYDYLLTRLRAKFYASAKWSVSGIDLSLGANISAEHTRRRGLFEKELFPGKASYGHSQGVTLMPAMLTATVRYDFDKHDVGASVMLRSESPCCSDLFLQPEYNNRLVDNPKVATALSAEASYGYSAQRLRLQAALFATRTANEMHVVRYYDDLAGEYADAVVEGIGRLHYGIELSAYIAWSQHFNSNAAITAAQYRHVDNPSVTTYADDDNSLIANTISQMKGIHVGVPQLMLYGDICFRHKGWTACASVQYWGLNYATPSYIRRTVRIVSYAASTEEAEILKQQDRLPDATTLDLTLAKYIKFKNDLALNIQFSARNILGSSVVYSSYEENRISLHKAGYRTNISPFANRVLYAYPHLFSLSASLMF